MFTRSFAAAILLILTSACSTVIEGRTQDISVDSFPSGAQCAIKDNDIVLARVQTPGVATINKNKNDVLVECAKDGYITASKRNKSDMAISSLGNMVMGKLSVVGDIVDEASGAAHKYDSKVFIALNPQPSVARIEPAAAPERAVAPTITDATAQLAEKLSNMGGGSKVVVTDQPLDEVLRQLMNGEQVKGVGTGQVSSVTAEPYAVMAQLGGNLHQAE